MTSRIHHMNNEDKYAFLNSSVLPCRLQAMQAAWYLGFQPREIPILVGAGLLEPLGHPPVNRPKFFLTATLTALRGDEKWFSKATDAISAYWRRKNALRRAGRSLRTSSSSGASGL